MIFFVVLACLFVVIGVWGVFSLRRNKRKWTDFLLAQGLSFDQEHQLIRQEAILLNLAEKQQVLWARGTNYLNESRPDSGVNILPYRELLSFKATINHELVEDFTTVAARLSKATSVRLEINRNEVDKLNLNPNDLADKKVRTVLLWWIIFLHELEQSNQP